MARRAGMKQARAAAADRLHDTADERQRDRTARTPNSSAPMTRPSRKTPARPTSTPAPAITRPCRITSRSTLAALGAERHANADLAPPLRHRRTTARRRCRAPPAAAPGPPKAPSSPRQQLRAAASTRRTPRPSARRLTIGSVGIEPLHDLRGSTPSSALDRQRRPHHDVHVARARSCEIRAA